MSSVFFTKESDMEQVTAQQHEQRHNCQGCARAESLELELAEARESESRMLESLASQTRQLEQTMMCLEESKLEIRYLHESNAPCSDAKKLRADLSQAQRAMDDLAVALKELMTELGKSRAEAERLRLDAEESFTAWREKERGLVTCIRILEDEIDRTKNELRSARVETSHLRDIVKQAVNESTVVKGALEIARNENSQLKDSLAEKEDAYMALKQDYECVKESEAAAMDSVKELSSFLAHTSNVKPMVKFPSENWGSNAPWESPDESKNLEGSIFDVFEGSPEREGDRSGEKGRSWEESPSRIKKRRQIIRAFGELLRIRSFHK